MHLLIVPWDVNPEIFRIGSFAVRWYGLLFASSFLFGYIIMQRIFRNEGLTDAMLDRLTIYMAIGVIAGARLGHCFFYEPDYYLANPAEILKIWHGGLASHGAAIGILLALWLFIRKEKKDYTWVLDRIAIVVALSG
ncbi:MAG: prolipoprotein diacylglyceryl transferase, partial [Bacteroidales bacterium]|nr:prolipoprotein diacylglyceryl transferase [Bacteroidales bacterium]